MTSTAGVVTVLVTHHLVTNRVLTDRLTEESHVPLQALTTSALLGLARRTGISSDQLGLDPDEVPAGLRHGGAVAAVVGLALAGAGAVPALRERLVAGAAEHRRPTSALHTLLVTIPSTVAFEEVAFRGVLLAALGRLDGAPAELASSVLFGLWHVLPSIQLVDATDDVPVRPSAGVAGIAAVTGVAGLAFAQLRVRAGSLAAPVVAHGALNLGAFLAGRLLARVPDTPPGPADRG